MPDYVIACVGGGSNAAGAFDAFLEDEGVNLIGVEAGGVGNKIGEHAVRFSEKGGAGVGVVEGYKSYWFLDEHGQVSATHSICAGLDYAGIGPLHAYLKDLGRVNYVRASDDETLSAVSRLAKTEGILSALESAHGLAHAIELAPGLSKDKIIVVNLSGRAEKDMFILAEALKDEGFKTFANNFGKNKKN